MASIQDNRQWALDARHQVETPEQIEIDFELAGPGSRFCALVIDVLLIWLSIFALGIMAVAVGAVTLDELTEGAGAVAGWVFAVVWAIVVFLLTSGYYIIFEIATRGQTPGKRAVKLRVIRDDGLTVTAGDSLIRNLLRIVDVLPVAYGVGGVVSMFHPLHKRLGDIAAGTIVVKEAAADYRAHADQKYDLDDTPSNAHNHELTPEEIQLIAGFLNRRMELLPDARSALARRIAGPLHRKYGGVLTNPEWYLESLYEGEPHGH